MNAADRALFFRLLRERSGIVLTDEKAYLLNKLEPVARKQGFASMTALAAALRAGRTPGLVRAVIEAMTTNESFFFRDIKPFEQFRTIVLPHLLRARAGTRSLRIWSAACAAGQEPYSLAMILAEERARLGGWQVEILATDISTEMVERARAATYSQFEVQRGLPLKYLVRYFEPERDRWQLKPQIRDMVQVRAVNLLDDCAGFGRMDVILCRNVLIYFDQPTKSRILDGMAKLLAPDGFLFLGGAETTLGVSARFAPEPERAGLYRKAAAPVPA